MLAGARVKARNYSNNNNSNDNNRTTTGDGGNTEHVPRSREFFS